MRQELSCGCSYDDRTKEWRGICRAHGDRRGTPTPELYPVVQETAAPLPVPGDNQLAWLEG